MAFTKVVGAGIHTLSNITSHNINSSGIITATKFVGPFDGSSGDFSGNVNIDGNLIVNGDTTTLNTTLREVELLRVDANSSVAAGIITQTGSGDILNLYDGATKVVTVDDEGNVIAGVGDLATHTGSRRRLAITDSANGALLHIRGQSPAVFFDQSGGNIGKIYQDNADLAIYAGRPDSEGANTVRIDSSGRVMIGTTTLGHSSADDLTIHTTGNGGITIRTGTGSNGAIFFADSTSGDARFDGFVQYNHGTNPYMIFGTATDEKFRITDTGLLQAKSHQHDGGLELLSSNNNQSTRIRLQAKSSGGTSYDWYLDSARGADRFTINDGTTSWLTILGDGKIGIGEISPNSKFEIVSGDAASVISGIKLKNDSTSASGPGSSIDFVVDGNNDVTTAQIIGQRTSANYHQGSLQFLTRDSVGAGLVERLHINSNGRLLINHNSSRAVANITAQVQLEGTTANTSAISIVRNSLSQYPPYLNFGKSRATSTGGTTIVNDNDSLGQIRFSGADGNDLTNHAASIEAFIDGTPGNNVTPGRLIFSTTSATGSDATEKFRISSNGQVCIGSGFVGGGGHLTIRSGGVNSYATQDYQYVGTPSNNSTTLAQIRFTANTTGASVVQGAKIQAVSDAAWSATGDSPTRLEFYTAPDGSASMVNRMTISSEGKLIHNAKNASGHVAEFNQTNTSNDARILINSPTDNNIRPAFIQLSNAGTAKWGIGQVYASTSSGAFHLLAGNNQESNSKFVVTTAGRVGIGTVNPDENLELFKTSGTNLLKVSTEANSTVGFEIEKTGSTTQTWRIVDGQTVNGKLEFYDVTDSTTRMCIDGSGRILINRTSQHSSSSERLSVNGMTSIQLNSTSTAPLYVFNQETTNDGTIQPFMYFSDGTGLRAGIGVQYSTSQTIINGQFGLSLRTGSSGVSGTERLLVQSNGTKVVKNGRLNISSTFIDFSGSISTPQTAAAIYRPADNTLAFSTANLERLKINSSGHTIPGADVTYDLGANTNNRWRNIYGQTLSLTSYATIGAIVANDPGSSYYAYNNRIGGGMAIVGTTDLYGNAHVKGGDFRVRSETGAMSYQVVSGIKTFTASDTFVGLAYVGHSHSIQIQYMIVENNSFNLGGAHGELSMFTTYGNSSYTQNHSFRLNAMNGGRINGDPVFTYTNSSAGSHGNNYVLRAKVGYSGTDHNFTIRYVIRGLSSGNMYV